MPPTISKTILMQIIFHYAGYLKNLQRTSKKSKAEKHIAHGIVGMKMLAPKAYLQYKIIWNGSVYHSAQSTHHPTHHSNKNKG